MHLRRLTLEHFRNHTYREERFPQEKSHFAFIGENSVGKSNLLEAVMMLALARSFRARRMHDLIQWGKPFARVSAEIERAHDTITLEIFLQRDPAQKLLFVNKQKVKAHDFIGQCPMVTFLPEDLELIRGEKRLRRRYLNVLLAQGSRSYRIALAAYEKILAERNALLKAIREGRSTEQELSFWNQELIRTGTILTQERQEFLNAVEKITLVDGESLTVQYEATTGAKIERAFQESLPRDLALGTTTVGPHRDTFQILIDNRAIETVASRSQERNALLALKFVEADWIEKRTGQKPLLVFDDILSELDHAHRETLLQFFTGKTVLLSVLPDLLPRDTTFAPFHFQTKRA